MTVCSPISEDSQESERSSFSHSMAGMDRFFFFGMDVKVLRGVLIGGWHGLAFMH